MHPCTCHPFHPYPHFLSPSLPSSLYLCPLYLKMMCFTSLVGWHRAWGGLKHCCSESLISRGGWMLRHQPCQPSVFCSDTIQEIQNWKFVMKKRNSVRWLVIGWLYGYFSRRVNLPPTPPCEECFQNKPTASRWQRHTELRSPIKVTTWSDVTAAQAAKCKRHRLPLALEQD